MNCVDQMLERMDVGFQDDMEDDMEEREEE